MAVTANLNDGPRRLRDGEFLVDCAKALTAFETHRGHRSEDRAAEALGISRSVLRRILGRDSAAGWAIVTGPNARAFAERCGVRLETIEWFVAEPGAHAAEQDSIARYLQFWRDVHGIGLGLLVPLTMLLDAKPITAEEIPGLLHSNETLRLCGPSGCGKSHLLTHLALTLPAFGLVPVLARAADFTGDIVELLDRAVSGVVALGFEQLVKTCGKSARRPIVILDALNECSSNLGTQLLAALQKLRAQFDFPILLSNQSELALPPTLSGPIITISTPNASEKRALVEAHLDRGMPEDASFSLSIISSAQDAAVWAEVFGHSEIGSSRFALYESYVRRRLAGGPSVSVAMRALALLAHEMRQSFVFTVPEATVRRSIERALSSSEQADGVRLVIDRSGLLPTGQGRAAFKHELLQDFFATEELLRACPIPKELGRALAKPINTALAEFAFGSLATGVGVAAALSQLGSMPLFSACLAGQCGPIARQYVEGECIAALNRLRDRYCSMSFDLEQDSDRTLSVDASRASPFNQRDAPYLATAMMIFPDGRLVGAVLDTIRYIDRHIEAERSRLRACYPETRIAWRVRIFTALYCMPIASGPDEFRVALQDARFGGLWRDAAETYERMALLLSGYSSLTPGQLYFLIEGFHAAYTREVPPPSFLYELAERAWSFHIYHLQLATTHMLTLHCHNLPEGERQRFIALVEGWLDNDNPIVNGFVIDVLKVLGALDEAFTVEDASAEFERVLAYPASQEANEEAFSIYCRMFDHPYDSAYAEAFFDLIEPKRAALLARAIQADATRSMFYSFLLTEIAKHPTTELVPALQRVATVPNADTHSIQDSISTFVSAIASLAKISAPLPVEEGEPDALKKGWHCVGDILYLLHTPGITQADYARASDLQWSFLERERLIDYPMRIVRDRWRGHDETSTKFLDWSRQRLLKMGRDVLANPQVPRSWFLTLYREREMFNEHVQFALTILEMYGDRSDLPAIVSLIEDSTYGVGALKAARAIESR